MVTPKKRKYEKTPVQKPDYSNVVLSDEWLSRKQTAKALNTSIRNLDYIVSKGLLPKSKPEGTRMVTFNKADIEAFRKMNRRIG